MTRLGQEERGTYANLTDLWHTWQVKVAMSRVRSVERRLIGKFWRIYEWLRRIYSDQTFLCIFVIEKGRIKGRRFKIYSNQPHHPSLLSPFLTPFLFHPLPINSFSIRHPFTSLLVIFHSVFDISLKYRNLSQKTDTKKLAIGLYPPRTCCKIFPTAVSPLLSSASPLFNLISLRMRHISSSQNV